MARCIQKGSPAERTEILDHIDYEQMIYFCFSRKKHAQAKRTKRAAIFLLKMRVCPPVFFQRDCTDLIHKLQNLSEVSLNRGCQFIWRFAQG